MNQVTDDFVNIILWHFTFHFLGNQIFQRYNEEHMEILILTTFGFIAYLAWAIWAIVRKRWKIVLFQVALPIAVLFFAFFIWDIWAWHEIFGCYSPFWRPIYQYDSVRSFNGDGFSFSVIPLPATVKKFINSNPNEFAQFPKRSFIRKNWSESHWKYTPVPNEVKKYSDFAFMNVGDQSEMFEKYKQGATLALSKPGNYFSYLYFDHADNPGNIDFFEVDMENDLIYYLNINT